MNQEFAIVSFLNATRRGSSLLWKSSLLMLLGMIICMTLPFFDDRLIAGVSIWEKPAKFFLSLAVQMITVAWAMSLLSQPARGVKTASRVLVAAAWIEMAYIIIRASRGEASHFNVATPLASILYTIMGIGAVSITASSAFIGWRVWQQRGENMMRDAAGVGLMLGAVLATIAGGYLSSMPSHWIGGDMTDATGLRFFNWSTTGGDLRVAHFIGLHAAQFVPLAALSASRRVVYGTGLAVSFAMIGTFVMALMGVPLLRV
jgi:hypothetical protein